MSTRSPRKKTTRSGQPAGLAAMVQFIAVGFSFVGALLLATDIFLATGRGSEADTIWVFPLWAVLFVVCIWGISDRRQALARGLALWGAELLGLVPAWLLLRGLTPSSASDHLLRETLSVMALGLIPAAALLSGSFLISRRAGEPASGARRVLVALAAVAWAVEAAYGVLLLVSLLQGS